MRSSHGTLSGTRRDDAYTLTRHNRGLLTTGPEYSGHSPESDTYRVSLTP